MKFQNGVCGLLSQIPTCLPHWLTVWRKITQRSNAAEIHSVEIAPTQLDTQEGTFVPPSRRLVLIGGVGASQNRVNSLVETPIPGPEVFAMSGSDTESFGSVSSGGNSAVEVVESESDGEEEGSIPIHSVPGTQATRGLESLDAVESVGGVESQAR